MGLFFFKKFVLCSPYFVKHEQLLGRHPAHFQTLDKTILVDKTNLKIVFFVNFCIHADSHLQKITILQTMSKKYSEIKTKLKIEITKTESNALAHLTHYFQNHQNGVSQYFKPIAASYLTELHKELNILEEPDFQYYLPVQWDIPFPPPTNPKFKFIDLFAGIGANFKKVA